ncbi:MAG: bifunctional diguanylate cyclase/phosphodiesterase [Wenzhouxiangella sp.]
MAKSRRIEGAEPDLQRQAVAISAALVSASPTSIDRLIEGALGDAGRRLGADHCILYLFDPANGTLSLAFGWTQPGIDQLPLEAFGGILAKKLFPGFLRRLMARENVHLPDVNNPPAGLELDAERLRKLKLRSLLLVPMFADDLPLGVLGVDRVHEPGAWTECQRLFLGQVAAVMTQSLLRVKAEREIARSEARYNALTQYNQSVLFELSLDGRYIFVAPNAETAVGYRPEELIGKRFDYLLLAEDAERVAQGFAQALREQQMSVAYEYRLFHKDGRQLWHRSIVAPVKDHRGQITSLVCNALDVTKLRRSEIQLRHEMQLTRILVRLASDYINLPVAQLDQAISRSLKELGEFAQADRAYVFAYDFAARHSTNTHEWCADGIEAQIDQLQAVPMAAMRDFLQPHLEGRPLYIPDVADYPHADTRELLQAQHIVSLITVPLMQDGLCLGCVGFDSVTTPRHYSESEQHMLRVFAEMLVNMQIRTDIQHQLEQEQQRLTEIINGTDAGTWEWDLSRQAMAYNERFARMMGVPSQEHLPRRSQDWPPLVHPQDLQPALQAVVKHLKGLSPNLDVELRLRHNRGEWIWLQLRARVVTRADDGKALLVSGIGIDISERKAAEADLRLAASVFTHSHQGIVITDLESRIVDVNQSFTRITGYPREEVLGQSPRLLNSGRHPPDFYEQMWGALTTTGEWSGEIWNRRRDGTEYAQRLTISTVRNKDGQPLRYVGLFFDITAEKQYRQSLERLAHFDSLTELPNRVLMGTRVGQMMMVCRQRKELLALAYIDVDHFKVINERYGQELGDQVLLAVSRRLQQVVGDRDTVARPGGDEFAVMLTGLPRDAPLDRIMQRLMAAVSEPLQIGELELKLGASIGVAVFPQDEELDPDQLLRQANQAMFEAKQLGRGGICYFDAELERVHQQRQEKLRRLRQAISTEELVLHYQPQINLRSGELIGVEALIRWQHPERGLLLPAEFLPAIEGDPLAHSLTRWVLSKALDDLAQWQAAGLEIGMAVNVSASAWLHGDFVGTLEYELAKRPGLKPSLLNLEVVETSMLEDLEQVTRVTTACAALGVSFALDDFGTGFSSLSHLKHLPIEQLKVDRSFVRDMLKDPDDLAIIEGIVRLGQAFDIAVLAEGVETDEHAHALLNLGCVLAQGYRIARPMPAVEIPTWLASWQTPPEWAQIPRLNSDRVPVLFAEAECKSRLAQIEARAAGAGDPSRPGRRPARSRFWRWLRDRRLEAGYTELWSLLEQFDLLDAEIQHVLDEQMVQVDGRSLNPRLQALRELSERLLQALREHRLATEAPSHSLQ